VAKVQIYLWGGRRKPRVPVEAEQAWSSFFERYDPLFQGLVERGRRGRRFAAEPSDLRQDAWAAVISALYSLEFDPAKGSLDVLLTVVAERAIQDVLCPSRRLSAIQTIDECLPSSGPGPEEACCLAETSECFQAALAELRAETSAVNYALFCGRFLDQKSPKHLAEEWRLTRGAVRARCHRMKRRLRELLGSRGEFEIPIAPVVGGKKKAK
jgi:RNA polymerase sigma factor (sigma-70 family)